MSVQTPASQLWLLGQSWPPQHSSGTGPGVQASVQVEASPLWAAGAQTESSQLSGHGSQVSPSSMTPLGQLSEQSSSLADVHASGQHPSPSTQVVCWPFRAQAMSHVSLEPVCTHSAHPPLGQR